MQAREIQASMDNKIYVTKSWAAAGCAYSVGNHAWEWEPLLAGRTRDGGCILGKGRPSWSWWSGSTTSEDKDTPRPPGMLIANSTPTITIGYSYIWQNEGDMHSLIGVTGFAKNLFMGLLAPASASQPANKRQMSAKTFAKLACQLLISWRRNTGCIQSAGPVSPEFDKSSSPADLAQGRQDRHRG